MAEFGDKYRVVRLDRDEEVDDAFVLRVRKDPVGWLAAWHYASLTYNAELAQHLRRWLRDNLPDEESLGTEGQTNREALNQVQQVAASPVT